ncbi:arginyl-tRNA--protein transferase 2-like isoform X1 [Diospyros lotus]|uniref:arginyl-tRNA--protein transferase 2-like isoform X1 n=1 Tax=Diospyros lotus TaxID=55363 RepID=UPI00224F05C1|nr:arginyl-tRNA--protein transferase 2-like isoform X1 [Diospyros lotus]XP_052199144.1 arginyl-tRNA--protein transferase 2-like isoform X1 [Diospyros lotus]
MADKIKNEASSSSSSSGSGTGSSSGGESVVVDVGRRRSSCGYCRSGGRTSISHGLWAHSLTVDHYQALLDKGWRRSGCFLYKPEMERTCCPSYTIRLKAIDFTPSKEQLRVYKRMQRFLDGTLDVKRREVMDEPNTSKSSRSCASDQITSSAARESSLGKGEDKNKADKFMHYLSEQIDNVVHALAGSGEFPRNIQLPKACVKKVAPSKRKLLIQRSEDLLFSCNISFQIAAALRRAEKDVNNSKLSGDSAGKNLQSLELSPELIAEKVTNLLNQLAESSGVSIRACNGHINFYSATKQAWLDEVVDEVPVSKGSLTGTGTKGSCSKISKFPQGKRRKLEYRLKRSSFDPEEYALYRKYQIRVHNDTPEHVTESSYKRFLVDTPLVFVPPTGNGSVASCGFGSFHQQYLIDGRLVAVGVIDILPRCLSSKYLFWDPDLAFLSLGKYSALQEIDWVKQSQLSCPSLEYYYLGYYIHSCSKMRYKAAYRPSELLCPLRYQWVSFDIARPLLDRKLYVVLSDFSNTLNGEALAPISLDNSMEVQTDYAGEEDLNDMPVDDDDEMSELDFEDSDDESGSEPSVLTSVQMEDGSVGDILIGLKGSRVRYKDLQHAFVPRERGYLETQLHKYMSAVGTELSKQMLYSLG